MDTPAPATPSKSVFKSKTILLNLILAFAACFPQVQAFVAENPLAVTLAITLVNGFLRLVTSGKISLISDDATGMVRLLMLGGTAAALIGSLPSCASLEAGTPVTTSFYYRDASGAKGGISFTGIPKARLVKPGSKSGI
jgi:carbon monoxide dehydrogenase subunit G